MSRKIPKDKGRKNLIVLANIEVHKAWVYVPKFIGESFGIQGCQEDLVPHYDEEIIEDVLVVPHDDIDKESPLTDPPEIMQEPKLQAKEDVVVRCGKKIEKRKSPTVPN